VHYLLSKSYFELFGSFFDTFFSFESKLYKDALEKISFINDVSLFFSQLYRAF
jgi:hypothetical protein